MTPRLLLLLPLLLTPQYSANAGPAPEPAAKTVTTAPAIVPEPAEAPTPAVRAPSPETLPEARPAPASGTTSELLPELPPEAFDPSLPIPPPQRDESPKNSKSGKQGKASASSNGHSGAPPPVPATVVVSGIEDLRRRVLDANWSIQGRMMDYEVKRRTQMAAKGMFDPNFNLSYNYEDSTRPNTVEQRRNLSGVPQLSERNHSFQSSIETLTPLGSKLSITASFSEYRNNLQRLTTGGFGATGAPETVSFIGVAFVQPLLKNAGRNTATAALKVAACETEQAWQDFRRQLMVSLGSAELAYWNVNGAARQVDYMQQSVDTARQMAEDTATLKAAGKAAAADVATAGAGEQERLARLTQARQRLAEAKALLAGFCGMSMTDGFDVNTSSPPPPLRFSPDAQSGLAAALAANPDYLGKISAKEAEDIRTAYMKNQKLPQLDFKASYGLNGLGTDLTKANEDITEYDFPAWGVGLELTVPLGNREAKNRYAAALARRNQAETVLSDLRTQLGNAVENAVQKIYATREVLNAYYRAIALNQQVLNAHTVDHKEGKADVRRVLEAEEDLSQSKLDAVAGLIQHRQALLEYELATGLVLDNRAISITKEELAQKTTLLAKENKISRQQYEDMLKAVRHSFAP